VALAFEAGFVFVFGFAGVRVVEVVEEDVAVDELELDCVFVVGDTKTGVCVTLVGFFAFFDFFAFFASLTRDVKPALFDLISTGGWLLTCGTVVVCTPASGWADVPVGPGLSDRSSGAMAR
jgi:hypothetical protein